MSGRFLCKSLERSVEIQVTNKIRNVTLHSPRSFCFSGYNSIPPSPRIPTGVTENCLFNNSFLKIRGCVGLLVYEADTFTLAILFSNPSNYSFYHMKLAMEISLLKVHLSDLEATYTRMYKGQPATTDKNTGYHRVKLGTCQEPVTVSAGHVRVTATMSNSTKSIVKVILETQ